MGEKTMNIILMSDELSGDDIQKLLQAIRDCEQKEFPKKELGVFAFVPSMTNDECIKMLQSINPPFAQYWGTGMKDGDSMRGGD